MAFRSLPNTKRGESNGDGRGNLRRFRQMARRIQRIARRNPQRAQALARRFRAQLSRSRGAAHHPPVVPGDATDTGKRRPPSDRVFQREAAITSIKAPRATRFGAGGSPF